MIKAIIFDFDGVLCESVEAKTEAFRKLFLDYPDKLDEIISYHMEKGGVSRYRKFEYIYKEILKIPLDKQKSEELGRKFTEFAYDEVIKAPLVKGTLEFLEKYSPQIMLFVASGTPEDEMLKIVHERKLDRFFKGVYGSPKTKFDIADKILKEESLNPDEVIFVGDAITDFEGAQQANIRFIGRLHEKYPDPFKDKDIQGYIKDLAGLEEQINKLT